MSDWANAIGGALASGFSAAATTGANIIGDQMKQQQAIEAEQRAADIRLDTEQRMMAMKEAMGARAAERFSSVVKAKASEDLPVEPQSVVETGVTPESAKVLGKFDFGNGPEDATGITGSADKIKTMLKSALAAANNPDLNDEQRADARGLANQLIQQTESQYDLNNAAAAGKTRHRTTSEAAHAALDETLQSDPLAYIAGTGMLGSVLKDEATTKAANLKERLATAEADRKERQANADRDSREAVAANRDAQREKAADQRFEAMMTRLETLNGAGGKKGQSAMVQNLEWLRDNLGFTSEQLADYVTEKKHLAPEDIAAKLLSADKFGDLTPETAMERAQQLVNARDKLGKGSSSSGATVKALPSGAVQVGTSGGKPVYQTPDGKKFIQD
jgi:hypothetical protein